MKATCFIFVSVFTFSPYILSRLPLHLFYCGRPPHLDCSCCRPLYGVQEQDQTLNFFNAIIGRYPSINEPNLNGNHSTIPLCVFKDIHESTEAVDLGRWSTAGPGARSGSHFTHTSSANHRGERRERIHILSYFLTLPRPPSVHWVVARG